MKNTRKRDPLNPDGLKAGDLVKITHCPLIPPGVYTLERIRPAEYDGAKIWGVVRHSDGRAFDAPVSRMMPA